MTTRTQEVSRNETSRVETETTTDAGAELQVANNVTRKIVSLALRDVDGLRLMRHAGGIAGWLERRRAGASDDSGGIRTTIRRQREVSVEVWMAARYGVHIPSVATEIRERVSRMITGMTDFRVRRVTVRVVDVLSEPTRADGGQPALSREGSR